MSNPVKQHDVPRTYLRRFAIDPESEKLKSMVYCLWKNEYHSKIEQVSIDSNKFKVPDLYTVISDCGPYIFENFFRENVEPYYHPIMKAINDEQDLSHKIREELVTWLYFNKIRNRAMRTNLENLIEFSAKINFMYNDEVEKYYEKKAKDFAKYFAKKTQMEMFRDEEMFNDFILHIENKYWIILRSREDNVFLTNDNPGFSINMDMGAPDLYSLNRNFKASHDTSYYFILSPKYCLHISPYWSGTSIETNLFNQNIEYLTASDKHIEFINTCTATTRTRFLVSNNKNQLDRFKLILDSPKKRNLYNKIQKTYTHE